MKNKYVIALLIGFFVLLLLVSLHLFVLNREKDKQIKEKEEKISKLYIEIYEQKEEIKKLKETIPKKHPIEEKLGKCINACPYVLHALCMAKCSDNSAQEWDNEAKKNFIELKKYLSKADYLKLTEAERNWEKYRKLYASLLDDNVGARMGLDNQTFASIDKAGISEDHAKTISSMTFFIKTIPNYHP